jgi:hypothetical protein
MSTSRDHLSADAIPDVTLKELVRLWQSTEEPERKERFKQAIIVLVEMQERSSFLARYVLRDFATWNVVLTEHESNVATAHKKDFFEPHLIEVLKRNAGRLETIQAINEVLLRVIQELSVADFAITASKRFRYDTTIRFLADDLKKRGVLSKDKEAKNKLWVLTTFTDGNSSPRLPSINS